MALSDNNQTLNSSEQIDLAAREVRSGEHIEVGNAKDLVNLPSSSTADEERSCLRKIDTWLTPMPMMVITYGLQYIDKVILNGASQFGIVQDLHLYTIVGQDEHTNKRIQSLHRFAVATLIFYWGYLAGGPSTQAQPPDACTLTNFHDYSMAFSLSCTEASFGQVLSGYRCSLGSCYYAHSYRVFI